MVQLPTFPPHMKQAADRQKGTELVYRTVDIFSRIHGRIHGHEFYLIVGVVVEILMDHNIMQQFVNGNTQQAEVLVNTVLESDPLMLLMLFSNAAMIFLTILFCVTLQKRTAASMGFVRKKAGLHYLAGAGAGLLLFGGAVLINVLTGSMTVDGISPGFSPLLFLLFLVGFGIQGMRKKCSAADISWYL